MEMMRVSRELGETLFVSVWNVYDSSAGFAATTLPSQS